jgi:hypothetical protein
MSVFLPGCGLSYSELTKPLSHLIEKSMLFLMAFWGRLSRTLVRISIFYFFLIWRTCRTCLFFNCITTIGYLLTFFLIFSRAWAFTTTRGCWIVWAVRMHWRGVVTLRCLLAKVLWISKLVGLVELISHRMTRYATMKGPLSILIFTQRNCAGWTNWIKSLLLLLWAI